MQRAKKSLGQNFLKSKAALRKIIEAGDVEKSDTVLEIGPGKGALTEKLLEKSKTVVAVEKDRMLVEFLKAKFETEIRSGALILIEGDILNFDTKPYGLSRGSYKIIANIPYNITGAILKKFLTAPDQPERMVLLVQKEVAERIIGRSGNPGATQRVKESILSISVKAYGEPRIITKVGARYFSPSPQVDSAVIAIRGISRRIFEEHKLEEEKFWELVRKGFAHKRKRLASNLKGGGGGVSPETLAALGNKRAEDLSLSDWITLATAS